MGDIHACSSSWTPFHPYRYRTVALVGLMGAGKSAIGKRLAMRLASTVDADDDRAAAGCSIAEFFEKYGGADFRAGERRVIARRSSRRTPCRPAAAPVSTPARLMRAKALTVWLRAELDVLFDRVGRRATARCCVRAT